VIGRPIRHSLSPTLFRWIFSRFQIAADYEPREVSPETLPAFLDEVRDGDWAGASVTIPHKETVRRLLDEEDPLAARVGAVNTLVHAGGSRRIRGYNTDTVGFTRALTRAGARLSGARVLVLGAGGASRAAVFASLAEAATQVVMANRTVERAEALARETADARCRFIALDSPSFRSTLEATDVLVNATRAGMGTDDESPLPKTLRLHPGLTVLDMVYRPLETALLRHAQIQGARTVDGLWMLVFQALAQLKLWTGRDVPDDVANELHDHLKGEAT
jgi:shikimate dehydrogenase